MLIVLGLLWWLTGQPALAQEEAHEVQRGESLSQIAVDHNTDVTTLLQLNGLEDIDIIRLGMMLKLPSGEAEATVPEPAAKLEPEKANPASSVVDEVLAAETVLREAASDSTVVNEVKVNGTLTKTEIIHVVVRGEHLGDLSEQYGVPAATIIQANDLADANIIVPGQKLIIPLTDLAIIQELASDVDSDMEEPVAEAGEESVALATVEYHTHAELPTGLTEPTEKWIDVDLSEQRVVAYEGLQSVKTFIVSTGLPGTPTVQGEFRIWAKTPLQDMYGGNRAAGDYYYLEDVPWVQYFYEDYALHGTNWHANFGQPMSRGCVNMQVEDAKWLFEWAGPTMDLDAIGWLFTGADELGTLVVVHE